MVVTWKLVCLVFFFFNLAGDLNVLLLLYYGAMTSSRFLDGALIYKDAIFPSTPSLYLIYSSATEEYSDLIGYDSSGDFNGRDSLVLV